MTALAAPPPASPLHGFNTPSSKALSPKALSADSHRLFQHRAELASPKALKDQETWQHWQTTA